MEILTKLLRHDHRLSGLHMEEEDGFVILMRYSKPLLIRDQKGATVKEFEEEADKNTYEVIGR